MPTTSPSSSAGNGVATGTQAVRPRFAVTWIVLLVLALANTLGVVYLVVIMVIAVSAIPLMLLTNVGSELTKTTDLGLNLLDHHLLDGEGR